MNKTLRAVRTLGVAALAVLGLMAFAASAQAEDEWEINGTKLLNLGGSETLGGTVGSTELLTAGGIEVFCAKGTGSGKIESHGFASGHGVFETCKVLNNKFCTVPNILVGGTGLTVTGHIVLHGGNAYLFASSTNFATLKFEGELCTLPLNNVVSGSLAVKINNPLTLETTKTSTSLDLTGLALLGVQLFLGNESVHLSAGTTAMATLTGAHAGEPFAVTTLLPSIAFHKEVEV